MINVIFGFYIFLDILGIFIIIDVCLSWLAIFQIQFRPVFIRSICDPLYNFVKNNITTTIAGLEFAPLIVMFGIYFLQGLLLTFFPDLSDLIQLYSNVNF